MTRKNGASHMPTHIAVTVEQVLANATKDHLRVMLAIEQKNRAIDRDVLITPRQWCKRYGLIGRGSTSNKLTVFGSQVLAAMRACPTWSVRIDSLLMEHPKTSGRFYNT